MLFPSRRSHSLSTSQDDGPEDPAMYEKDRVVPETTEGTIEEIDDGGVWIDWSLPTFRELVLVKPDLVKRKVGEEWFIADLWDEEGRESGGGSRGKLVSSHNIRPLMVIGVGRCVRYFFWMKCAREDTTWRC